MERSIRPMAFSQDGRIVTLTLSAASSSRMLYASM